jgi:tRNA(Ile)-lysidine synthase
MTMRDPVRRAPRHASSADSVETTLEDFIDRCGGSRRMLIALSGGGDSVGLLTALSRIRTRRPAVGLDLLAATVDHGLRPGSRDEAVAAGRLAENLGIPHAILDWAGEKPAAGIQAAAREARYRLLAEHGLAERADLILTGHNLDDDIETYHMRLARNDGVEAHGMAEAVLLSGKVWAARPLLGIRREAIRDYLRRQGISWAEDPSNASPAFERVRLRGVLDGAEAPDLVALMERRHQRLLAAAGLLEARAVVIGHKIGVVDLAGLSIDDAALVDALGALAALLGGRQYPPGEEGRRAMASFLADGQGQMTAGRVVFDRRGDTLYLQRENRGLPKIAAAPGDTVIWDQRFSIVNGGAAAVAIGPDPNGAAIFDPALFDSLPGRVRQLARLTGPYAAPNDADGCKMTAILPGYDKFLPLERLELGNVLAKLMGLPHFPLSVIRHRV